MSRSIKLALKAAMLIMALHHAPMRVSHQLLYCRETRRVKGLGQQTADSKRLIERRGPLTYGLDFMRLLISIEASSTPILSCMTSQCKIAMSVSLPRSSPAACLMNLISDVCVSTSEKEMIMKFTIKMIWQLISRTFAVCCSCASSR